VIVNSLTRNIKGPRKWGMYFSVLMKNIQATNKNNLSHNFMLWIPHLNPQPQESQNRQHPKKFPKKGP